MLHAEEFGSWDAFTNKRDCIRSEPITVVMSAGLAGVAFGWETSFFAADCRMASIRPVHSAVVGAVILGARPAGRRPPSPEDDGDGDECNGPGDGMERCAANQ